MNEKNCKNQVKSRLNSRIEDLEKLWKLYQEGNEEGDSDLGEFCDYGLSFDYVAANTFDDQKQGYFRYQLSWGGPSDEFRFFCDPGFNCYSIEYWFLDWFDGASIELIGKNEELLMEIYNFFNEIGSCQAEFEKATE